MMVIGRHYIVVLPRGWIGTGRYAGREGDVHKFDEASTIRHFGTDRGLGQLALEGKQEHTIIDPCGEFWYHDRTYVMVMPCCVPILP
jgi:hypothetical protein